MQFRAANGAGGLFRTIRSASIKVVEITSGSQGATKKSAHISGD